MELFSLEFVVGKDIDTLGQYPYSHVVLYNIFAPDGVISS